MAIRLISESLEVMWVNVQEKAVKRKITSDIIKELKAEIKETGDAIKETGKRIEETGKRIEETSKRIEETSKRIEEIGNRIKETEIMFNILKSEIEILMNNSLGFKERLNKRDRFLDSIQNYVSQLHLFPKRNNPSQ